MSSFNYVDNKGVCHSFSSYEELLRYDEEQQKARPFYIRAFNYCKYWCFRGYNNIDDFIRGHFILRHNIVKLRRLSGTWHDTDMRMLHANFELFSQFVEKEKGLESLKYQYTWMETDGRFDYDMLVKVAHYENSEHGRQLTYKYYLENKATYETLKSLYDWWQSYDPNSKHSYSASFDAKEEMTKLETENLVSLIKLRGVLWT